MDNKNELTRRIESLRGSSNRAVRALIHHAISSIDNGEQDYEDGALLLGRGGCLPEQAYFHIVYGPSDSASIEKVEHQVGAPIPDSYKDFLFVVNGVRCFAGDFGIPHLALLGTWPHGFNPYENKHYPYEIANDNYYSRLKDLPRDHWVIGSYQWDGSIICMEPLGHVYRRENKPSTIYLNRWETFDDFIEKEFSRLIGCFNPDFSLINPEIPTTP